MKEIFFLIFAVLTILTALCVPLSRKPVNAAMNLLVSFVGLAALFVLLETYFLAVLQVMVYAGAIVVLFLFIIMLMDIKKEKRRDLNLIAFGGGIAVTIAFVVQLASVLMKFTPGRATLPALTNEAAKSDVKLVGHALFTDYNFHLQVIGVLLLVSTIGVIVLSRRATK
jgi:NADH-quinone oxidoreductase subunit J